MWLRCPRPQQKHHSLGLCDMCLQHQSMIGSRMACYPLLGITCLMYAVKCNACNCCTMLVCPGRKLLCVTCTLLLCQLWYLLMEGNTALSDAMEATVHHIWLHWSSCSFAYVSSSNVSACFQCFVLSVDPNNVMAWDCHQGVGPADYSNIKLIVNE